MDSFFFFLYLHFNRQLQVDNEVLTKEGKSLQYEVMTRRQEVDRLHSLSEDLRDQLADNELSSKYAHKIYHKN